MASPCRICHPEQFHTRDPDPQHIEVDVTEYPLEASDSDDDGTSSTSSSDDSYDEEKSGNAKKLYNSDMTEHVLNSDEDYNDNPESSNNSNTSDQKSVDKITKRDTHNRNHKRNQKHKRGKRGKGNRRESNKNKEKRLMSRVLMPDGEYYRIPDIVIPHWKCDTRTKLINLGQNTKRRNREFDIVETAMQKTIAHHDNCESGGGCFDHYNIIKIQKIVQGCAWRRYHARKTDVALEAGSANEKMLFHGTDAVWEIVSGGFDERFSSTNGQFGPGLYFARHSSVANKFVFGYFGGNGCKLHRDKNCYICDRHLLLCRVTLGKAHQLATIENLPHPPPGYHSVEALVGKEAFDYPEYVIYRGEQAYPEYLITYKIVKPKEDDTKNFENDDVIVPSRLDVKHQTSGTGYQRQHHNRGAQHQNLGTGHKTFGVEHQMFGEGHQNLGTGHKTFGVEHQQTFGERHQNLDGRGGYGRGNSNRGDDRTRGGKNNNIYYDRS